MIFSISLFHLLPHPTPNSQLLSKTGCGKSRKEETTDYCVNVCSFISQERERLGFGGLVPGPGGASPPETAPGGWWCSLAHQQHQIINLHLA